MFVYTVIFIFSFFLPLLTPWNGWDTRKRISHLHLLPFDRLERISLPPITLNYYFTLHFGLKFFLSKERTVLSKERIVKFNYHNCEIEV